MQHFPSKVDTWLRLVLSSTAALCFASAVWSLLLPEAQQVSWVIALLLLTGGLCLWLMTSTYYRLYDDLLLIRSGPFRWRISLASITSIKPSNNPLSSPALSLKRLEIGYAKHRTILISPAEQQLFIQALQACEAFRGEIDTSLLDSSASIQR